MAARPVPWAQFGCFALRRGRGARGAAGVDLLFGANPVPWGRVYPGIRQYLRLKADLTRCSRKKRSTQIGAVARQGARITSAIDAVRLPGGIPLTSIRRIPSVRLLRPRCCSAWVIIAIRQHFEH